MPAIEGARFRHVNIIARDWRKLAAFYETVFGCVPAPPPRQIDEPWLAAVSGVPGAALAGVHLRVPGHGAQGPTLEIYQYRQNEPRLASDANREGFAHIAFEVDDLDRAMAAVLAHGGAMHGQRVATELPGVGPLEVVYMVDPEGNIVELQSWGGREEAAG